MTAVHITLPKNRPTAVWAFRMLRPVGVPVHQHTVKHSDVLAFIKAMGLEHQGVIEFTVGPDTITVTAQPKRDDKTQSCDHHGGSLCTHTFHIDIVRE